MVEYADRFPVYPVRLGPSGVDKQIFLGIREADVEIDYVRAFLAMALAHRDAADPIPRKPRAEAQRRRDWGRVHQKPNWIEPMVRCGLPLQQTTFSKTHGSMPQRQTSQAMAHHFCHLRVIGLTPPLRPKPKPTR